MIVNAALLYCHNNYVAVFVGIGFNPLVYNVSEGDTVMLRVVLNTTTDRIITVDISTQAGTAEGRLHFSSALYCSLCSFPTVVLEHHN